MRVPDNKITDIVDIITSGNKCYINIKSLELIYFPDPDQFIHFDDDIWKEEMEKVEKFETDLLEIEPMSSTEEYIVMQDFSNSVEDSKFKYQLLIILEEKKPFANFRSEIEKSVTYRKLWFDFRFQRYFHWIQDQLQSV